jgi:hypothetical protein
LKFPRRSVLKALGGFAALPIGRMLSNSIAMAQGMPALKFIGVYHPHGISAETYARRAGETETTFDLNFADSALTPFDSPAAYGGRSFKNRIITFEGVDLAVAELSGTSGHGAAVTLFTGSMSAGADHNAQGMSMDQYLARTLGLGNSTPFPTLNLGVGSPGDANQDAIAHGPGGAVIRNQLDPVAVFNQVFSNLAGMGTSTAADAARRRGQSVIDFVRGDLNSLSGRLAAQEKLKLDQHLSALRDIETRLTSVAPTTCTAPARPVPTGNADASLNFPQIYKYNGGEPYFDRIANLQIDLLAQALLCDSTRFATLFLDDPGKVITVDGTQLPADVHNEVAHTYSGDTASTQVRLGRLNRYYYGKIARLMQRLDEGGLLDSTVIMAGSDMGNPSAHSTRNIPLLLAGGANGALTMGRRIKAGADCPASNQYCTAPTLALTPHNKVLVSVAKLFGDQSNTFGVATDPALITGGWAGL